MSCQSYLLTGLPTFLPACLPACLPTYLPVSRKFESSALCCDCVRQLLPKAAWHINLAQAELDVCPYADVLEALPPAPSRSRTQNTRLRVKPKIGLPDSRFCLPDRMASGTKAAVAAFAPKVVWWFPSASCTAAMCGNASTLRCFVLVTVLITYRLADHLTNLAPSAVLTWGLVSRGEREHWPNPACILACLASFGSAKFKADSGCCVLGCTFFRAHRWLQQWSKSGRERHYVQILGSCG